VARSGPLTGRQKAAILLISLGPELSAKIFQHLEEDDIEQLTMEIANLRQVDPKRRDEVLAEFSQLLQAHEYITLGGINYARQVLEAALGEEKAHEIIGRLTASLQVRPFDFARKTDPSQLANFIQNEHPQTIALILAYLDPNQAGIVLSSLPADKQVEVTQRLATMNHTLPEVLFEVEGVLEKKLANFVTQEYTEAGGLESVVEVLNRVDRGTERTIMEGLEELDAELADEIKKRMFMFEDLVTLDDRAVQLVLREVDNRELALALKMASSEVAQKIYRNMSKRAAEMLQEDLQYLGPVRLRDVEEAQQKIVNVVRRLEEAGEIIVARGGEEKIIV
jgi:flagellar motor switch protein FliG